MAAAALHILLFSYLNSHNRLCYTKCTDLKHTPHEKKTWDRIHILLEEKKQYLVSDVLVHYSLIIVFCFLTNKYLPSFFISNKSDSIVWRTAINIKGNLRTQMSILASTSTGKIETLHNSWWINKPVESSAVMSREMWWKMLKQY